MGNTLITAKPTTPTIHMKTHMELYKEVIEKTLHFVEKEWLTIEGSFYSAFDADSLNVDNQLEEGAFYVWTKEELKLLITEDFELFSDYYNVNNYGFWEHDNYVLIRKDNKLEITQNHSISNSILEEKVIHWQKILLKERNKKEKPRLDDKSLTSWNALMLKGYINAYTVFNEQHFLDVAIKNATFIYTKQLQENGNLNHNYKLCQL